MLALGPLAFSSPLILLGLLALPAIWLLVRALPPQPRRVAFPPVLLLRSMMRRDPPRARTPPWLLLLRCLLAALLMLALAGPLWNPQPRESGNGPLLVVIDNGWEAAGRWDSRQRLLDELYRKATRENRPVVLLPTAPAAGKADETAAATLPGPQAASDLRAALPGFLPVPFSPDHGATADRLAGARLAPAAVIWISDGLLHPQRGRLLAALEKLGKVEIHRDPPTRPPLAMLPLGRSGSDVLVTLRRPARPFEMAAMVRALGADGRSIGEATAVFEAGASDAAARLALPASLRGRIARLDVAGDNSAGTVQLLDARASRPSVGLAGGESGAVQPMRSPLFYLERALEPLAEVSKGSIDALLADRPAVLILADVGQMVPQTEYAVRQRVEAGMLLIRFAGPHMASGSDPLLPTRLRSGDRAVGGALSWEEPQGFGPFPPDSPFAGLAIPDDVRVQRQLLAVPAVDLADRTWARLTDGTPIVTATRLGAGHVVLVHTTANTEWSNLVLSGLFVDMLDRLLRLAQAPAAAQALTEGPGLLAPQELLDGFGRLARAPEGTPAIAAAEFDDLAASPRHPPGLYGPPDAPLALDLTGPNGPIDGAFRFRDAPGEARILGESTSGERDLAPPLFLLLALLALSDLIILLAMRGLLPARLLPAAGAALLLLAATEFAPEARAQNRIAQDFAIAATSETRVGYVKTGDARSDAMILAGLGGLRRVVNLRTAVRLGEAMAIDPARDPMVLFPLIYWPVPPDAPAIEGAALVNLADFLMHGGIVLFDTGVGDAVSESLGFANPLARESLRRLVGPLDLPPLEPVAGQHVLARSFYLMDDFPGRISGRELWVTSDSFGEEASVSPVVIGAHDWPSAWAIDDRDRFLVPALPGGLRQRELAFRFGVNLVMYALTGTYKADQLHLPALIERLGE